VGNPEKFTVSRGARLLAERNQSLPKVHKHAEAAERIVDLLPTILM
jgi:hypothetical protein